MFGAEFAQPRLRISAALVALMLHVLLVDALIRAFAPSFFTRQTAESAIAAITVAVAARPARDPKIAASQPRSARPAGRAGRGGQGVTSRALEAPISRIALASLLTPSIVATGSTEYAGARAHPEDPGIGDAGTGPGAQGSGAGSGGGGLGARAIKIAGDINSARDFPAASRDARLGHFVVIAVSVRPDGTVGACRILTPSPDAEADRITCRLAAQRFRFQPARDKVGNRIESEFGWKQRWFRPGED